MKKRHLLTSGIISLSLALAGTALLANNLKNDTVKPASAAGTFVAGAQTLTVGETYEGYLTGKITLTETSYAYTLTLDGFQNKRISDGTWISAGVLSFSFGLGFINVDRPVNIVFKGTNIIHNEFDDTNFTYPCGIFSNTGYDVNFVGYDSNATLTIEAPGTVSKAPSDPAYQSSGIMLAGNPSSMNFTDCNSVTISGGDSGSSYGIYAPNQAMTVTNSNITITSSQTLSGASVASQKTSVGALVYSYTQQSGTVNITSGNTPANSSSCGLYATTDITVNGGSLTATSGITNNCSSNGIIVNNGSVIVNGGNVTAKARNLSAQPGSDTQKSIGIYSKNSNESNKILINNGASKVVAVGDNKATNFPINSFCGGYKSLTDAIEYDDDRVTIDAGESIVIEDGYKSAFFRPVYYTLNHTSPVEYDEFDHPSINSLTVQTPSTGYTVEYKGEGQSSWSEMIPWYDKVGTHTVNYRITTTELYSKTEGSVDLVITKAAPLIVEEPVILENEFVYSETKQFMQAGEAEGGTMVYSVDDGEYSAELPVGLDAGSHTIKYKVLGDENHNDTAPVTLGSITISKAEAEILSAPTPVSDFEADGEEHALVTAGTAKGGTLVYSVNDGDYSAAIPTAKDAGTYEIKCYVVGDRNHNDSEPVSVGTVVVSPAPVPPEPGPEPEPPEPGPEPTPVDPTSSALPGWAIALIIVGGVLVLFGCCYVLLFFVFNRYIINGKQEIVRVFPYKKHDGDVHVIDMRCRKNYRKEVDVYKTRKEAEEALNK